MAETTNKDVLRLIISGERPLQDRAPTYATHLDGAFVVRSAQPLYDGARELLGGGYHPDTLLTVRHSGKPHDNFKPATIGYLARWTVTERDRKGLRLERWRPRSETPAQGTRGGVILPAEPSEAPEPT